MGDTIRQHVDQHFLLERCDLFGGSFDSSVAIAAYSVVIANDVHLAGRDVAECDLIGAIRLGQAAELASSFPEIKSIPSPEPNLSCEAIGVKSYPIDIGTCRTGAR
jgi:hypothetical protein